MVKEKIQMIEGYEYVYPKSHKIVGIITEDGEELSFHFKPIENEENFRIKC